MSGSSNELIVKTLQSLKRELEMNLRLASQSFEYAKRKNRYVSAEIERLKVERLTEQIEAVAASIDMWS